MVGLYKSLCLHYSIAYLFFNFFNFLQAAVKALETAKDLGYKTLEIKTDSKYTINGKDLMCLL